MEKSSGYYVSLEDHWAQYGTKWLQAEVYDGFKYLVMPEKISEFSQNEAGQYEVTFDLFINLYANAPPGVYDLSIAYSIQ